MKGKSLRSLSSISVAAMLLIAAACASPPDSNRNAGNTNTTPTASEGNANAAKTGLGSIKVGSRPTGATVLLIPEDEAGAGAPQRRGSTPTTITGLEPGKYVVHLEKQGYKAFQKSVEVKPDETVTVVGDLGR